MGRIARATVALSLLGLLACGCADKAGEAEQNAKKVAAASTADARSPVVDEPRGFRLGWPGAGWKLLHEADARKLAPQAAAAAVSADGIAGVVVVRRAPAAPLEAYADAVIKRLELEQVKVESHDDARFADQDARRFSVTGKSEGVELRYVGIVFRRSDVVYQLLAWGAQADSSATDARFAALFDAFKLLDGKSASPGSTAAPPDTEGPHWRVVGGAFEGALSKLRIKPPKGWRMVLGRQLERISLEAEVGLVSADPAVTLLLWSERVPAALQDGFADHLAHQLHTGRAVDPAPADDPDGGARPGQPVWTPPGGGSSRPPWMPPGTKPEPGEASDSIERSEIEIAGAKASVLLRTADERQQLEVVQCEGQRCLRGSAHYSLSDKKEARKAVEQALAAVTRLEPAKAEALARQLSASDDPHDVVGADFALRNGVYRNFSWVFGWTKPKGTWRLTAGIAAQQIQPDAVLYLEEPRVGLRGMVTAGSVEGAKQSSHHGKLVARLAKTWGPGAGEPKPIKVDDVDGLQSVGSAGAGPYRVGYRVVTLVRHGWAVQVLLWGLEANLSSQSKLLDAVVAGLQLQAFPTAVETKDETYHDRRLGLALKPPPGWTFRDLTPAELVPRGAFLRWSLDGRWIGVVAANVLEPGQDHQWFVGFLEQLLRDEVGPVSRGEPEQAELTVAGMPAQRVSWSATLQHIDALLMQRGHTIYAVLAMDRGSEALELAQQGFKLLP